MSSLLVVTGGIMIVYRGLHDRAYGEGAFATKSPRLEQRASEFVLGKFVEASSASIFRSSRIAGNECR